ncbi:LysR family transcriptional regulator [Burkholderia sp. PAMC 26561]|uniref:LysR family transcriptional regulator n=1 Tax=Burkholderia sp. PAMC 26561 TaxID=1795043 RepID=UPI00076B3F0F|nr:LysR family transcriptional regulator [Burkholderia sp. PAMC 26561]AME26944.1 hypothetical protein AXG89_23510 [Burkholderia sp. PAMC 26561]AME27910.1 hypothetical protein AXG89_29175 [Burkholderia sp. PAMC 26561]
MADKLAGMQVFVKTAECGSFTAAASQLGMSAQMAGKHVATLEKRVGARLINRSTHSQSLTEAGRLYLEGCKLALAAVEDAEARVTDQIGVPQGALRIAAPIGIGSSLLIPHLISFLKAYPGVSIELNLSDRIVDVVAEGFDVALRIGNLPNSALISRVLCPYRMITCASPEYLADQGIPAMPEELEGHQCLDFTFPSHPAPNLWLFKSGEHVVQVQPKGRLVVNDSRSLIAAALLGFGIIQIGESKVQQYVRNGSLVELFKDYEGLSRPLQVVFASQKHQNPKVRVFIDWLVQAFAELG